MTEQKGPIAWMVRNPVAANLLMFVILIGGVLGLSRVKTEIFPSFSLDVVNVSTVYPGASPEDVEQGIVLAIEEEVSGLDGVKRITSQSREGLGVVNVELLLGANRDRVLADVKNAVDRIQSFPEDAEEPAVSALSKRSTVIRMVIAGDADQRTLYEASERARKGLLKMDDVSQVDVDGLPELELSVEVSNATLRSYGLTLDDVATRIAQQSRDLPAGKVDSTRGQVLVRVSDRAFTYDDFANLIIVPSVTGADIRLGDLGTIRDGFEQNDQALFFNGQPAVQLTAYRVGDESPISVSDAVSAYQSVIREELPSELSISLWDDDSQMLRDRIDLLRRNAQMGLVLVVGILAIFLNLRLAFWVSLGVPVSFMGAFFLMPVFGQSVNMISLFALIVTLGMVVDDAIIIGENIHDRIQKGEEPHLAAINGTREMSVPVSFAILTTIAAFAPLFFVPGMMGKIFGILPAIVSAVLLFSLLESFFVLPSHLSHAVQPGLISNAIDWLQRPLTRWVQEPVARGLSGFIVSYYRPSLKAILDFRYVAVAVAMSLFVISVGAVASGLLPFNFFPKLAGNTIKVTARLPYGAPIEQTEQVRAELERSFFVALDEVEGRSALSGMLTSVGEIRSGGGPAGGSQETGTHLLMVEVELIPSDQRSLTTAILSDAWEANTPDIPGLESLVFTSAVGPGAGAAVAVQLSHSKTEVLANASADLADELRGYSDITAIENEYAAGKAQLDYHVSPAGRSLGLDALQVGRQVRAAFFGSEALREQRGRNELKVMVRLPEAERASESDFADLMIRSRTGAYLPLSSVASYTRSQAPTAIRREGGERVISVTAERAAGVESAAGVNADLAQSVFPKLMQDYPGLSISKVGQEREQGETFASLGKNFLMALFVIYALLAIPSRSYLAPLAIMFAIPLGFVGAVAGHLFMGYSMSIISMFGIIALSGVVVNDSLVLVDAAQTYERGGLSPRLAVIEAGARRMRPILLTSLTTFFGLLPMIFETSVQAQFLIPMAISLGFGVLFATGVILIVVPAMYLIMEDLRQLPSRIYGAFS